MKSAFLALGALVALLACAACTQDDPGTDGTGPGKPVFAPAPTLQPAPRPSELAPMDVSSAAASAAPAAASASATIDAAAAPASSTPPTPSSPGKSASPATSGKAATACGDKPLPPCPLYAWMKANTSTAMSAEDFDALATALDKVVTFAPAGYGNWASISKDGASAARAQNIDAVKAACRSCHTQYKDKYKKEMRDRPI